MDHLPKPARPVAEPLQVPLLSIEDYDGGDFNGYPERQAWGERLADEWEAIFLNPPSEFQAFLQRWLYFGTIECTLGEHVNVGGFRSQHAQDDSGVAILDSSALVPLLHAWMAKNVERERASQRDFNQFNKICGDQFTAAVFAHNNLSRPSHECRHVPGAPTRTQSLSAYMATHKAPDPRDPRIALSIELMLDLLNGVQRVDAANRLSQRADGGVNIPENSLYKRIINERPVQSLTSGHRQERLVVDRMAARGSCPSDSAVMFNAFSTSTLLYIESLGMPDDSLVGHGQCTDYRCSRRTLSEDTYERSHAPGCGGCRDSVADQGEIDRILRSGSIPMIRLPDAIPDSSGLDQIVLNSSADSYIAISHVWSDGLGNVNQNAIPTCQLRRIGELVRKLPAPLDQVNHIWLDTICVPPDSAGMEVAQGLALERMRDVYEKATAVLVLDRSFSSFDAADKSDVELLVRAFISPWMRRLWTFQEGCLATKCILQFADAAVDIDAAMGRVLATKDPVVDAVMVPTLLDRFKSLRGFTKGENSSPGSRLNAVARSAGFRSTSVATDEALCLAALLGLDLGKVVSSAPERRMHTLWRMVRKVPTSLVFSYDECMEERGLGWAPRTLLQQPATLSDRGIFSYPRLDNATGSVTPVGLMVLMAGLKFKPGPLFIREQSSIVDLQNNVWWNLKLELNETLAPRRAPHAGHDSSCACSDLGLDIETSFGADEAVVLFRDSPVGDIQVGKTNFFGYLFTVTSGDGPMVIAEQQTGENPSSNQPQPLPILRKVCEAQLEIIGPGERLDSLETQFSHAGSKRHQYGVCIRRTHGGRAWLHAATGLMNQRGLWCIE